MIPLLDPWGTARRSLAAALADNLPLLEARLRTRAIDAVAARVVADLGLEVHALPATLAALARCADGATGEVDRLRSAEAALVVSYQSAATPAERRELLARQLRVWARERAASKASVPLLGWITTRLDQAGDLAALGRNLDLEAAQERFATEIADRIDEIEVAYHALAALSRQLDGPAAAVHVARDGGVLRLAVAHADPSRPAPVRRAALLALAALLQSLPARERLGHLGLDAARSVLAWSRGISASRWVQVAALEIGTMLFPEEAPSLLAERIRARDAGDRDGPILRRNALRLLGAIAARPPAAVLPIDELPESGAPESKAPESKAPESKAPESRAPDSALRPSAPPSPRLAVGPEPVAVALLARDDPSEHVRQELVRQLLAIGTVETYAVVTEIAANDASPRVVGLALRELARKATERPDAAPHAERAVAHTLSQQSPPLATRTALEAVRALCAGPYAPLPPTVFVDALVALAARPTTAPEVSDEAAAVLRLLEVESRPVADRVRHALIAAASELLEGERTTVELPRDAAPRDIERALAVASRGDMGFALRRVGAGRYVLTRGEPRGFRLWRLLHELRTPMPDKRKGWLHTIGRVPAGELIAPPVGMAEVTPTRVPGERHVYPPVGGWGPFVPRVDDLLAAAGVRQREIRLITVRGTVKVRGPSSIARRLRARAVLTLRYDRYAQARMRSLIAQEPAEQRRFTALAGELGFSISLGDTDGEIAGHPFAVAPILPSKFLGVAFPIALPLGRESPLTGPTVPVWIDSFFSYLVSPAGNVPVHLAWIAWLVLAFMILRAAWIMSQIERARRGIPLTIGGWGTRGKSGSERLKAALFHALRYDVVVKTTGCEAMFIHAMRDLPAQEIFIYRPYDKATIWEQRNILAAARSLRAQVFLWECMALQPLFVDTLCAEWMRDEITTLTNAYPDHEDIQGPSGEDVARVIARFMPTEGRSFTTEEQMLPLLRDAAQRKGTELVVVPPIDADLLPVDLLDRLPYQEHPRNVALILALAEHFGVDREFALVEIADHVILDLGVLKTYPTVLYCGRRLTFSNGMSANERAGFLSNWTRLAFDKQDPDAAPGKATVMVVNNRADRVARSRVFAQIIVEDIGVDHVVLINSNLGGMMQFITEGLDARLRDMTITGEGGKERALDRFDDAMRKVGIPARGGAFEEDLTRMLCALPLDEETAKALVGGPEVAGKKGDPEALAAAIQQALAAHPPAAGAEDIRPDVVHHAARLARRLSRRDEARAEVIAALDRGAEAEANGAFRAAFRELFLDRIAVLWNADAKGDKVIDFIAREVPPGFDARLMGSQNIKGTGLDFVYRWLSIDRVRSSLERMKGSPSARREVLTWILSYSDFGLIDCREALAALRPLREQGGAEWAEHANLVDGAIRRLEALEREKTAGLNVAGKAGLGARILLRVEQFVDHMDSVRRTRWAAIVMRDLFAMRIGHGRAALLLREIVARQKGGWLVKDLAKWASARWGWMEARRKKDPPAATALQEG